MNQMFVPVVDREQRPLMPTTPARARRWIKNAKVTALWKGGLFCVRLNIEPSAAHTYLNIQANARTGVKAPTHQGKRRWNRDFSPLQVGKHWFYEELGKLAPVRCMQGFQTKELRVELGLKKTSKGWDAHCAKQEGSRSLCPKGRNACNLPARQGASTGAYW